MIAPRADRPVTELLTVEPSEWSATEAGLIWGYAVSFAEEIMIEAVQLPEGPEKTDAKMRAFLLLLSTAKVVLAHVPGAGLWDWPVVKDALEKFNTVVEQRFARSKLYVPGQN